tara:strand:+ start:56 stop:472 length:417 start_codon:yes stop_codon:yes gene_type:complete
MKTLFILAFACIGLAANAQTNNLTVEVTNFKNANGKLRVALFTDESNYLKDSQFASDTIIYNQEKVAVLFANLPAGEYAISIYHDENDNGKLDANFMGIPSEPYAFSNNAPSRFGPAKYTESKFTLDQENQIHSIKLN